MYMVYVSCTAMCTLLVAGLCRCDTLGRWPCGRACGWYMYIYMYNVHVYVHTCKLLWAAGSPLHMKPWWYHAYVTCGGHAGEVYVYVSRSLVPDPSQTGVHVYTQMKKKKKGR